MMRSQVSLRCAVPDDAERLVDVWSDVVRRAERAEQVADMVSVIERVSDLPDERLVVAEYDGEVAGAVHLRATTVSPLNLEPVVQAISPHVLPDFRRRGIGRALMEAAVGFAEERGIGHVASAASAGSRDANRFMARLALGPPGDPAAGAHGCGEGQAHGPAARGGRVLRAPPPHPRARRPPVPAQVAGVDRPADAVSGSARPASARR